MVERLQRQMYGWQLLSVHFRNTRGGLMACVHCMKLETLSSGRSGGVLVSHSDLCPLSTSCHHSHSCCSSRLCCMHGNSACVSGVYKVRSILQMWIIMEIRQMKTIFQNYLVISELECVMRWFRNTEHSVMCLCMLTLALIPNKIKTWKVRNTRSSLRFGITDKLQICHKSYYSKIYYFYYNSGTRNDISLVDAPI